MSEEEEMELDPRIQIELEKLNSTTDEINKLEIEYDEANTTFHMLLNESTRRLKILSKKLGGCIERARPYYEALEDAKAAQRECQKAAVLFQRASEIHMAAKETVALAEEQFMTMSKKEDWQFDNAWQEMLNHATIKVTEAENQKAESGREHQRRAIVFKAAEGRVKSFEERLQRSIVKARPYFDEKSLCQEQLNTQKERIQSVKREITRAKTFYAQTLKQLEQISNEIHMRRGDYNEEVLKGPREPGVGAELETDRRNLPDINFELDKCELRSVGSLSEDDLDDDADELDDLKVKFKELAVRPVNGGEGQSMDGFWESELKDTADKLDHIMLMKECAHNSESTQSHVEIPTD